ncbi:MAG TPA: cupin domain-containing protein [Ktedonobacteraceae bacterium]|nr:cupin domain-containing protein [Ktedonobacteraceae bacterium]
MDYTIVNKHELPHSGDIYHELEGYLYGNTSVSVILVDIPPGEGPKLHSHPYEEIFIVQEGQAIYTIGSTTLEAKAGQIAIVPAGVPHKFVNSGQGRLLQVDIHNNPKFITEWLEE